LIFEIEIFTKKKFKNLRGEYILSDIFGLGIKDITKVDYSTLYFIDGNINFIEAKIIASELLSDKIIEDYFITCRCDQISQSINSKKFSLRSPVSIIEVWYRKGVTDTVAESVVKAVKDLGIDKDVKEVKAGHKYYLYGVASRQVLNNIVTKLILNTLVQDYEIK
jgi:phosphoribosylformylglycinamidine synthase